MSERKAKLIYWAVHNFGPRWKAVKKVSPDGRTTVQVSEPVAPPPPPADIAAVAEEFFEANNPTLEQIDTLTVAEIQEAVQEIEQPQESRPDDMETERREQPDASDSDSRQPQESPPDSMETEQPEQADAADSDGDQPTEAAGAENGPPQDHGTANEESRGPASAEPPDPEK